MTGAIAGGMIGSPYERSPIKYTDIYPIVSGFTDDTVLTVVGIHAIINDEDNGSSLKKLAIIHNTLPYGHAFKRWMWDWENQLKKGDNLILAAFGGGFTWGSLYLKWAYDGKENNN